MAGSKNLCSLPYDIRQLIYDQLFPAYNQLYLMASRKELVWIRAPESLPMQLLRVNRLLHHEASGFLYNRYLFNIIGPIQDCLRLYPDFEMVLQKYARQSVRIDCFGNGVHSDTCCISLQPGNKHVKVLNKRRRGQPSSIEQLRTSVRAQNPPDSLLLFSSWTWTAVHRTQRALYIARYWILSFLAVLVAVYII